MKDTERQICEMQSPRVLVTDKKIGAVNDLIPVLEQLVKTKEPLFIVAEDITGEALSALVVNKLRGVLDIVAIKAPSFGDRRKAYLQDIAIATGATYVADEGIAETLCAFLNFSYTVCLCFSQSVSQWNQ